MKVVKIILTVLKVLVAVILLLIAVLACLIHFGIWYSRGLNTPLDRPSEYSNRLWVSEDGRYAFVADTSGRCYGAAKDSDNILRFRIGSYSPEDLGHYFSIVSTEMTELEELSRASRKFRKAVDTEPVEQGFALLYDGIETKDGKEVIDYYKFQAEGGEIARYFEYIEVITDEGGIIHFEPQELAEEFSFRDTPAWPPEMLRWLEQRPSGQ